MAVTASQVGELMKGIGRVSSLSKAAVKSGMDRKTARKYVDLGGKLPTATERHWRTHLTIGGQLARPEHGQHARPSAATQHGGRDLDHVTKAL